MTEHVPKYRSLPDTRYTNSSEYQEKRALTFRAQEKQFAQWLKEGGADVLPTCSEYEVIRYRAWDITQAGKAKRPATHVIFRKVDGRVTFTGSSSMHFDLFIAGKALPEQNGQKVLAKKIKEGITPGAPKQSWAKRTRAILRLRDGEDCCICGKPAPELPPREETDMSRRIYADRRPTVEHWLARHLGGDNHIDNLKLAHASCNRDVGHRTPEEKQQVADMIRKGLVSSVEHWVAEHPDVNPRPRVRIKA